MNDLRIEIEIVTLPDTVTALAVIRAYDNDNRLVDARTVMRPLVTLSPLVNGVAAEVTNVMSSSL